MCVGNLLGGRLSDRYTPGRTIQGVQLCMMVGLLTTFFFARYPGVAVLMMCLCTACLFGVSAPQQLLLLRFSKGGEMMGAALVQVPSTWQRRRGLLRRAAHHLRPELQLSGLGWRGLCGRRIISTTIFCQMYRKENAAV
mgnify:CR=1 FL=1